MVISLFTGCGSKAESDTDKTEKETTESTAEEAPVKEGEVNSGTFTMSFDMSSYEKGQPVRLWIPCPQTDDYQTIKNENVELDTAHATSESTTDANGNKILYVEWDKEAAERTLTYTFDATRKEILAPELAENSDTPDASFDEYLKASSTLPTDGAVKELADQITEGKETNVAKVRAIYDWIGKNVLAVVNVRRSVLCRLTLRRISIARSVSDVGSVPKYVLHLLSQSELAAWKRM